MHSTLFEICGIPIRSYGFMMVVGFAIGLWRVIRIAPKREINPDRVYDLALIVLMSGIVGARVVYILLNLQTDNLRDFFAVWNGGLSFHGGVLFAVLAAYIYTKRMHLPFWKCADLLTPSVAIGYAFARIGCFLNGCCYGVPTNVPWGVRFMEQGTLTPPSHPTQIYAFFANIIIFFLLVRLEKLKRGPGFIFTSYLGLYSIYRFLNEFLRKGYSAQVSLFGLTQAQIVSLVMLIICVVVIVVKYYKSVKTVASGI